MSPIRHFATLSLLLALTLGAAQAQPPAPAQTDPGKGDDKRPASAEIVSGIGDPTATVRFVESRIKELESASGADAETAKRLIELYRKVLSNLEAVRNQETKSAALSQTLESAPVEIQRLRTEIEDLQAKAEVKPVPPPPTAAIADIEQQLIKEAADEAARTARLADLDKTLQDWPQGLAAARQALQDTRKALDDLEKEAAKPAPEGESAAMKEARLLAQDSRQRALRAELLRLDREILSQGIREDLQRAERDKAQLELKRIQSRGQLLREELGKRRLVEAERAKQETAVATRAAEGRHALVGELAAANAKLSEQLSEASEAQGQLAAELDQIRSQAKKLDEEYRATRQRMEISGLSEAMGQILLSSRQQLPDTEEIVSANREREERLAAASLRQIRFTEDLQQLRDLDTLLKDRLAGLPPDEVTPQLKAQAREQLTLQRDLLGQALSANQGYLRLLGELDLAAQELLLTVTNYRDYLAQHLLWTRSAPPLWDPEAFISLPRGLRWLLSPHHWLEVGQVLLAEASQSPRFWLPLIPLMWLIFRGPAMKRALLALAEPLRRVQTDSFRHTLAGLALTLLLALRWPLLIAALGWRLSASPAATVFSKGLGTAAIAISLGFFSLRFLQLLCLPGGVADRHFRWTGANLGLIRRHMTWAAATLVPLGLITALLFQDPDASFGLGLQRLSLIALTLGLTWFLARLLHPTTGLPQGYLHAHPEGWLNRLRHVWYPGFLAIPLGLVLLAMIGFVYTAGTLLSSLVEQLWLLLALVILQQSILRWLGVTRRRLALQAALEQPLHPQEDKKSGATLPMAERRMELASLDEQTRRLLNAVIFVAALLGLWAIWSDVMPAFTRLRDISLWTYMGMEGGEEKLKSFSLASVAFILATITLGTIAVRNLPALIEILLLDRFAVSPGARYAIKTLTAYALIAIAAMIVSDTLGISWGRVQWLVAALGVGIGFGLQEIVANFISGLIILFERPVRVGDVVTIGDTTGTVTKIRIRATTVRNWDRQELLVPNKQFITGQLLNWTLSDALNRIVIRLGVDYSADVGLAMRLMAEAVAEDPRVLKEPTPTFIFESFGDSALLLQARCFVPDIDDRGPVTSELQQTILRKFREHAVSLPFPQRDVHLKGSDPLEVHIAKPRVNASDAAKDDR